MLFLSMMMRIKVEEKSNFDAFYPFFIIIVVYLVTFFRKRAKIKREAEEKKRTVPIQREAPLRVATPPPPVTTVRSVKPSSQQKASPIVKKRKPRIVNLIQGLKSTKELVILSEILSINSRVK